MKNSKEGNRIRSKRWRGNNLTKSKENQKKTYQNNREYYLKKRADYRKGNRESLIKNAELYRKKNPKKFLQYMINFRKKYGITFGRALQFWSLTVRKRDQICQICNNTVEHAHHLFYQKNYPKLQLNPNNGIGLCKKCHKETHGVFV